MMMRSFRLAALAAGLASCVLSAAQDEAKKVTFQARAATAKALFPALSKVAGTTFTTSPQTEDEVLLIDVKDVTLGDLMKQIAKVSGAEWKQESDGYRLIRSQSLQNQQERDYFEARAQRVKAAQDRLQEELTKLKPLTSADARAAVERQKRQMEEVQSALREGRQPPPLRADTANANPAARLALRLISSLNPVDVARMPAASRVVFSSMPTRAQRPLPSAATRAISEFIREHQIWIDAQPPANPEPAGFQIVGPWGPATPMENGFGKVNLVLTRILFGSDVQCEVLAADGSGNIFARQFRLLSLSDSSPFGATAFGLGRSAAEPEPSAGGKPLELSQEAKDHATFMSQLPNRGAADIFIASSGGSTAVRTSRATVSVEVGASLGGGSGTPRLEVTPEWRQRLVQPEKNDPLSYAVGELFSGLAASHGANLVASLPDSILISLSSRSHQAITDSQLVGMAKSQLDLAVDESAGWLTVMPRFPSNARENRVDRGELGRLLTSIQKDGRLSLDNLARYAASRPNPVPLPGYDARYVNALFPFASNEFSQSTFNWRMLQLFAQLSPPQRRQLADGGSLSLGALSPAQMAVVSSLVFDDMAGPIQRQAEGEGPGRGEVRQSFAFSTGGGIMSFGSSGGRLSDERTEFLPNGLPAGGQLTVALNTEDAVYASRKDGTADPRYFSAEQYGSYLGIASNMLITGPNAPSVPQYDQFRLASVQTMDFHFQLTARAMMDRQLRDSWFTPGATDMPYASLPQEFRNRVDEMARRMKDAKGQISFGGGGGVRPPD